MKLDYTPLSQPVTKADIAAYKQTQRQTSAKQRTVVLIVCAVFIAVMLVIAFTAWHDISPMLFVLGAVGVVGLVVYISSLFRTRQLAKLFKFASKNNLRLIANQRDPGYTGMIFDNGHTRSILEGLVFDDFEIGNYQYVTGSGKNRQTHGWGYARIKLTRRLPHMVLDAKKNNFFGKISNLPDAFSKRQTLALEGDFNNYFTLYAPKEYERDALYVFTPDVMAALVDAGAAYDMEVIDDYLILYTQGRFKLEVEQQLSPLLGVIEKISSELRDQSHRYADERVGDRTMNYVAPPGQRLKTGIGIGTVIILVVFALYVALMFIP